MIRPVTSHDIAAILSREHTLTNGELQRRLSSRRWDTLVIDTQQDGRWALRSQGHLIFRTKSTRSGRPRCLVKAIYANNPAGYQELIAVLISCPHDVVFFLDDHDTRYVQLGQMLARNGFLSRQEGDRVRFFLNKPAPF